MGDDGLVWPFWFIHFAYHPPPPTSFTGYIENIHWKTDTMLWPQCGLTSVSHFSAPSTTSIATRRTWWTSFQAVKAFPISRPTDGSSRFSAPGADTYTCIYVCTRRSQREIFMFHYHFSPPTPFWVSDSESMYVIFMFIDHMNTNIKSTFRSQAHGSDRFPATPCRDSCTGCLFCFCFSYRFSTICYSTFVCFLTCSYIFLIAFSVFVVFIRLSIIIVFFDVGNITHDVFWNKYEHIRKNTTIL